jgi:hypothetical protein
MRGKVIVSGGDAKYFPLILDLIQSIRQHPAAHDIATAIVDGGLTELQKRTLVNIGVIVAAPFIPDFIAKRHLKKRFSVAVSASKLWLNEVFRALVQSLAAGYFGRTAG